MSMAVTVRFLNFFVTVQARDRLPYGNVFFYDTPRELWVTGSFFAPMLAMVLYDDCSMYNIQGNIVAHYISLLVYSKM